MAGGSADQFGRQWVVVKRVTPICGSDNRHITAGAVRGAGHGSGIVVATAGSSLLKKGTG